MRPGILRRPRRRLAAMLAVLIGLSPAAAQPEAPMPVAFEDFASDPASRWTYVADGVMGGVSRGQADMVTTSGGPGVRLTGTVSTDNNGGFIQVRRRFDGGWPADARGIRLSARGNGQQYHVFLRTTGLARVWHSYRHAFTAGDDWASIEMDFTEFRPSHEGMPPGPGPEAIRSIGIVAYGRDFEADVTVRSIELY